MDQGRLPGQEQEGGDGDIDGDGPLPIEEDGEQKNRRHRQRPDRRGLQPGKQGVGAEDRQGERRGGFPYIEVKQQPG